ncbi:MAG: ABC transporter substrate-binding protein [Planctomycetota bacterium]|jgi:ABC-type branched-subunit amino acid transport system substrate-binding protein
MRIKTNWVGILLIIILIIPSVVGAEQKVRGVTDTEVVIGWTTPLSGPAALWGVTALGGKAWADYINDQGGIHGRKIKIILKDDGYNPARALANLQEMKGKIFAVCGLLGTAVLNAAKDFFPDNNIPLITAYGDVRIWQRTPRDRLKNIFVTYPDYEDEAKYITTYTVKNLGTKTIAMFYQNDDYGKMALVGVKKGVAATGGRAKLVMALPYEFTERALATHALKLKESGADTLILYPSPTHGAIITKEIAKIGYQPQVLTTFTLGFAFMYNIAGPTWEGTYISLPGNSGQPGSDPDADRVANILKKYNPKIAGKEYLALFGAVSMMHLAKGLENAGRNLTPETLVKGMEKIYLWKPENLGASVTYAPDRRHGNNASRMGVAKGGKVVALEPYTVFHPLF